ncbi:MAG: hypothetical protein KJO76_06010 [Gammaproteobacteria bacterium]|nr:hypothetical protein [Gammaproteobacteria bacterium]
MAIRTRPLCSNVFMNLSESRIERIRWSGSEDERWYVDRLFERPQAYRRWESSHFSLVKKVAANRTHKGQIYGLRKARFSLVQRQALFQHLRDAQVRGWRRELLISAFHPAAEFRKAVAGEHEQFLRSNSSLLCSDYLGSKLLNDERFEAELETYRSGYMEFFSLYCDWIVAESQGAEFPLRSLLSEMKQTLTRLQSRMIVMPVAGNRRETTRSAWD